MNFKWQLLLGKTLEIEIPMGIEFFRLSNEVDKISFFAIGDEMLWALRCSNVGIWKTKI